MHYMDSNIYRTNANRQQSIQYREMKSMWGRAAWGISQNR